MPLDAARWSLEISAIDKTAAAFSSATARMNAFGVASTAAGRQTATSFSAAQAGLGLLTRALAPLAAAFSVAALAQKALQTGMEVADLNEAADKIGVTVEALQALQYQAVQGGVGLEQLNTGIGKFSENIGKAAEGDKAMIESLQGLGVKILDLKGNLLPTEELLVEVARKITAIDDPARKVAAAVEFFGKAGKQMIPTLAEIAKGFGSMSAEAKAAGALISTEAIAKFDKLADSAAKAHLVMRAMFAENAAGPLTTLVETITSKMSNLSTAIAAARNSLGALLLLAANPTTAVAPFIASALGSSATEKIAKEIATQRSLIEQAQIDLAKNPQGADVINAEIAKAQTLLTALEQKQQVMSVAGKAAAAYGDPDNISILPAVTVKGALDPIVKGSGGGSSAAQPKVIDEAAKAAEKLASWMRDANVAFDAYIANEEVSQQALFMSKEAAMALRLEQEMLNKAKADDVTLTGEQKQQISGWAEQMAAASEKTRQMTELFDLAKEVTSGFFTDFMQSLRDGQSLFEALGNAGMNALNKIADKLMQMAVDDLVSKAFGGGKGGGGGGLFNFLGGLLGFGGGSSGTGVGTGTGYTYAHGAAFAGGNVIPFARGGIVSRPTLFPMANGAGLMGEAGPEAVMPLRRGPGGRLGVEASGGGGGAIVVNIHNYAEGSKATAKQSKGPGGEMQIDVIVEMVEGKMAGRMARGQGSLGRVIEGTYGVQRQGR